MKLDRKEDILQKTFILLLTKGYDSVSISDIQNETGMSRGLLYHYYGSKEELFRIAGETFLCDLLAIDTDETRDYTLVQMIDYIVKRYITIYKEWGAFSSTSKITIANYDFLIYRMIEKEERIAKIYSDIRAKERQVWREAAKQSLERDEIHTILSADKIACHFMAIQDGSWMEAVENEDVDQYLKRTERVLMDYYELLKIRN